MVVVFRRKELLDLTGFGFNWFWINAISILNVDLGLEEK